MKEASASQEQSCLKPENTRMVAISSAPNLRFSAASNRLASPQHLSSTQLSRKSTKPAVWGEDDQRVEGGLLEWRKENASGRKRERLQQPRLGYETTEPKDAEGTREEAGVGRDAKSRPEKVEVTFWGEDRAGVAKRRPRPTTSAGPTGPPDYSHCAPEDGGTPLSDGVGRAAGASFGRGKAQGQSPGRPPGPAPRPDQPSWRRSPPDGVLGDSLKSQNRSAPPARAFQRTLSCDWRGGWLRPPRGRRWRKAGGRLRANSRPVRRAAPKRVSPCKPPQCYTIL